MAQVDRAPLGRVEWHDRRKLDISVVNDSAAVGHVSECLCRPDPPRDSAFAWWSVDDRQSAKGADWKHGKGLSHLEYPIDARWLVRNHATVKRLRAERINLEFIAECKALTRPTVPAILVVVFVVCDHKGRESLLARPHEDEPRAVEQIVVTFFGERRCDADAFGDEFWGCRTRYHKIGRA